MNTDTMHIESGMEVYGTDGEKIGKVTQVWPSPVDTPSGVTSTGYFKMEHGGILGVGAKELYVPFSAVDDYAAGDCVTLSCTKDECDSLYSTPPEFLSETAQAGHNTPA